MKEKNVFIIQDGNIPCNKIIEELERRGGNNLHFLKGDSRMVYFIGLKDEICYVKESEFDEDLIQLYYDKDKNMFYHWERCIEQLAEDYTRDGTPILKVYDKPKNKIIMWDGSNLEEIIKIIGLHPDFSKWFKTWIEYKEYIKSHGNILKLFFNGGHYEIKPGCSILCEQNNNIPITEGKYKVIIDEEENDELSGQLNLYYRASGGKIVEYLIPDGYDAKVECGKVILTKILKTKFKVRDWIVYKDQTVTQIISLEDDCYTCSDKNGIESHYPYSDKYLMRAWTIDDAKNGDILTNGNNIFIFKELNKETEEVRYYCSAYVDENDESSCDFHVVGQKATLGTYTGTFSGISKYIKPATKDYCQLLLQKLYDNYWTFDFKNLKLERKLWVPHEGDDFCYIYFDNTCMKYRINKTTYKVNRYAELLKCKNCFRTEDEANELVKKLEDAIKPVLDNK